MRASSPHLFVNMHQSFCGPASVIHTCIVYVDTVIFILQFKLDSRRFVAECFDSSNNFNKLLVSLQCQI